MAGKLRYWKERNGRYSARIVVATDLRPYLPAPHTGKAELEEQLGGDKRTAIRLHAAAVARLQQIITIGRVKYSEAMDGPKATASLSIPAMAQQEYQKDLDFDAEIRSHHSLYAEMGVDLDRANRLRDGYSGKLSDIELALLVGDRLERYRRAGQFNAAPGSSEWRAAAQALCAAAYEAMAREDERNEGDFTGLPSHPLIAQPVEMPEPENVITFKQIIDQEVKRRARGRDSKPLPERTVGYYRRATDAFAAHRKSNNAATVTIKEGEAWRDSMLDSAEFGNKTIKQYLQNASTVINWGQSIFREELHPGQNPMSKVQRPDYKERPSYLKAYTENEAKLVLAAARKQELPLLRWIPWLCAYSGMRVQEAGGLKKEDFFQHRGRWLYRVTTIGGRGLKNEGSERRIPVHQALIDEGFMEFFEGASSSWLFLGVLGEKINAQPRVSEWVREMIPFEQRPDLQPNHGWRHYFEDLCRLYLVPDDARKYITGRKGGGSADMYGKSDLMLGGLAKAMDMIEPINLADEKATA